MPENLRKARNIAIIVSVFELVCAFGSAVQYEVRRSRAILLMTLMNVIFVCIGFFSKLSLSFCGLIVHSTYMISFIGGFFIYVLIDFYMRSGEEKTGRGMGENNVDQTSILLLFSLPLLLLFVMGIYSLALLMAVDDELEGRRL